MTPMTDKANELTFQNDVIEQLVANGWQLGTPEGYNRELALYEEDALGFVKETQPKEWEKFVKLYPRDAEAKFLERVTAQRNKADPNAAHSTLRTFGTLGVLRHAIKDRGTRFKLCQFEPEHNLKPDTLRMYQKNRLRVVPELVYSPWATEAELAATGLKAKNWRIDLVLFVNGLPVATLELKSEFKQAVKNAIKQYKLTRLPVDPVAKKPEPLLTFKRGALVHFAVSQYEVYMATKLEGLGTTFLPFNRGTKDGGAGNDVPDEVNRYATDYLWNEVLMVETSDEDAELTADEMLDAVLETRRASKNLSYFAFPATPKPKTLELFGRLPNPDQAPSKKNKPEAFHVYSMRQAIEEGFILDVLKNYTNYKVAYNLALKIQEADSEVESKKAKVKLKSVGLFTWKEVEQFAEAFYVKSITDQLTEQDLVNYAYTIRDKVRENESVMSQIANNTDEQAMLGDFPRAIDDAILNSSEAHQNQMFQLLSNPEKAKNFAKLIFEMLKIAG